MPAPIVIADYDPVWPVAFERIRATVLAAFAGRPAEVEHVGSTSVPGLAAKPILDIDVVVPAPGDLAPAIEALAGLGYRHRGDLGIPGREAFEAPDDGEPTRHLYLVVAGSLPHRDHLDFRDHLRAHPEAAEAYAKLKRQLAAKFRDDREGYTQAKAEFVLATLAEARTAG